MAFLYNRHKKIYKKGRQGINFEFFFNGRGVESQRSPLGMLRSLLNQLFRQDEVIRPLVRDEYREKYHAFGGSGHGWHWLRSELEQLLQDSILLSAQQGQVTIFVDELDGVGAQFASEITAYFHLVGDSVATKMASAKYVSHVDTIPSPPLGRGKKY
ncbi:hypothetical protein NYO67_6565 [Aspergillus flavus]|nr:hypothetical protein NYO67_6565 [Aspergillus flavus]